MQVAKYRYRLIDRLVICATVVLVCFVALALPVKYAAGKETLIWVNVISKLGINAYISWGTTAAFGGLWYRERRLRKKTLRTDHARVRQLEQLIDPNRTSSGFEEQ